MLSRIKVVAVPAGLFLPLLPWSMLTLDILAVWPICPSSSLLIVIQIPMDAKVDGSRVHGNTYRGMAHRLPNSTIHTLVEVVFAGLVCQALPELETIVKFRVTLLPSIRLPSNRVSSQLGSLLETTYSVCIEVVYWTPILVVQQALTMPSTWSDGAMKMAATIGSSETLGDLPGVKMVTSG